MTDVKHFELKVKDFENKILEYFSTGKKGKKSLFKVINNMINMSFSHERELDDQSYTGYLRDLKYRKLLEMCYFNVDVDCSLVYNDHDGTECEIGFNGDLNLFECLHPENVSGLDLEWVRDMYIDPNQHQEVFDCCIKHVYCNDKEIVVLDIFLIPEDQKI
tara:strand:+ start:44 stop:526 length:483 start_codon:yes stop_codon:yes gene_type:complete